MTTQRANVLVAASTQKPGEAPEDCQDAFDTDPATGRFAVADGAGNSFFPAPWADLLAQRFCTASPGDVEALLSHRRWEAWLKPIRQRWRLEVEKTIDRIPQDQRFLFENRLKDGSFAGAAFVGLWLRPDQARWTAITVGDSCLFHIRGQRLVQSFPMQRADQFSARTEAVVSIAGTDEPQGRVITDELRPGDLFLLASDALSKWLLTRRENGAEAWSEALKRLLQVRSSTDLKEFIDEQQRAGRPVDHDDVTVVAVAAGEPAVHAGVPAQALPASRFEAVPGPVAASVGAAAIGRPADPPESADTPAEPQREWWPAPPSTARIAGVARRLGQGRAVLLAILAVSLLNLAVSCRRASDRGGNGQQESDSNEVTDTAGRDSRATAAAQTGLPVLLLPSAQPLYLIPGANPTEFLRLERPAEIRYAPESESRWRRVMALLWVAPESQEIAVPNPRGDSLIVNGALEAWTAPDDGGVGSQRAGVINMRRAFQYDDKIQSGGRTWYRLQIPTWIRDAPRTADGS